MLQVGPHVRTTNTAVEARTIGEMFLARARRSADRAAFYSKEDGAWVATTWSDFRREVSRVVRALLALGLERGDRVAILGPTQPPWAVFDIGAQLAGMVSFGIYPRQSVEEIRFLLDHSDARVVFVESEELKTLLEAARGNEKLVAIVPWTASGYEDVRGSDPRLRSPAALLDDELDEEDLTRLQAEIDPDDAAIFVYTSGTTGPPKAAMTSHANILGLLRAAHMVAETYEDDITLAFLPLAHAAERVGGLYLRIAIGITTAYASSMSAVLQELREVMPTVQMSVPRVYEKAYSAVQAELGRRSGWVRALANWSIGIGRRCLPYRLAGTPLPLSLRLPHALADAVLFRKVRAAFGGRLRHSVVGAAPTAREILEFFWMAGVPLYEVYGLTEATAVTHINRPGAVRLGSVGKPFAGMEHRLADDGEVQLRGPLVFKGYFKDDRATAETIRDGWLRTGDIGRLDGEGFLHITDRKKHIIITAGGKNLSPANIETAIASRSPLISKLHVHGDARPYVTALIVPSPLDTLEFGLDRGLVERVEVVRLRQELMDDPLRRSADLNRAIARIVADEAYRDAILRSVRAGNRALARVERVRRFHILERDLSQAEGELTPTMKVKRKVVEARFADLLDRIYREPDFGINAE